MRIDAHCISWTTPDFVQHPRWYLAEDHLHQLQTWAFQVGSGVTQKFHTLDLFGASGRIADAFERRGYRGTVFDIKEDKRHDVTSESGMKLLFLTALQWLGYAQHFSNTLNIIQ